MDLRLLPLHRDECPLRCPSHPFTYQEYQVAVAIRLGVEGEYGD